MGGKYLGDIISTDGRNDKNVAARKNKGQGLVNEKSALIVELILRQDHFETAILRRNTDLVSCLIFNFNFFNGFQEQNKL